MKTSMRMLVVDDDVHLVQVMTRALERNGHRAKGVLTAEHARGAINRAEMANDPFDVLIADEQMPNMTGTELISWVQRSGLAQPPRCFLMSGHFDGVDGEHAAELAGGEFLRKPFRLADLVQRLHDVRGGRDQ